MEIRCLPSSEFLVRSCWGHYLRLGLHVLSRIKRKWCVKTVYLGNYDVLCKMKQRLECRSLNDKQLKRCRDGKSNTKKQKGGLISSDGYCQAFTFLQKSHTNFGNFKIKFLFALMQYFPLKLIWQVL